MTRRTGSSLRWLPPALVAALVASAALPGLVLAQSYFVHEVVDGSANLVGYYTSLALDASGNPHVSYQDHTTFELKYSRKIGGVWTLETAAGSTSIVSGQTSLALDASGNPHVSYADLNLDLRYARKSGGVWTTETADGSANQLGDFPSLALDASGNPHISYMDFTTGDLKYARKIAGVWTRETADASANEVGLYTSLALDASGNAHVSYQNQTTFDLKYARRFPTGWTIETVDASANLVGYSTSIALDASGNPHVSYWDGTASDLKYARASAGAWTIEIADGSSFPGGYSSLVLDGSGIVHVSYFDSSPAYDLKYARRIEGVWVTETADASPNVVGAYTSLALDAHGNAHISHQDATTSDLKYTTAAVRVVAPGAGVTWAVGSRQNIAWVGVGPVDILLSADGGNTFQRRDVGITASPWSVRVPHLPTRFAMVRIERSSPFSTSDSDSFFRIDATITLAKFDARVAQVPPVINIWNDGSDIGRSRESKAIHLTWETRPGIEADIRYRVERASSEDAVFRPTHPELLDKSESYDRDGVSQSSPRYRLIAINGLGEESMLGETTVTGALAIGRDLSVQPNPARGGTAAFVFRAPLDPVFGIAATARVELAMFDLSGRRVVALADGEWAGGVHVSTWDGRDDAGRDVAAGVYFAQLSWNGVPRATERVTVVR